MQRIKQRADSVNDPLSSLFSSSARLRTRRIGHSVYWQPQSNPQIHALPKDSQHEQRVAE